MREMRTLPTTPLTVDGFAPYGRVLEGGRPDVKKIVANQGTATRYLRMIELEDLRPGKSYLDVSVYRCKARETWPLKIVLMEKHPMTTQLIVPMTASRYVVLVARGGDRPDLSTIRSFMAAPNQGIAYEPGCWHHPLLALDRETDFTSFVYDDGTEADCTIVKFTEEEQFMLSLAGEA
jgi:ureidoglycolate lyase